jgi:hypothetical protein
LVLKSNQNSKPLAFRTEHLDMKLNAKGCREKNLRLLNKLEPLGIINQTSRSAIGMHPLYN